MRERLLACCDGNNWLTCSPPLLRLLRNRGPEIELCFCDDGTDPVAENDWHLLPFMALSDGAHAYDPTSSSYGLVLGVNLVSALCRASGADIALVSISRSTEDFSYFTLRRNATATEPATSLFGISCTRQIDASSLIQRPPDVTRSTVQKAVVVVTDSPQHFGQLREKLSIVTSAWFAQRYVYLQ